MTPEPSLHMFWVSVTQSLHFPTVTCRHTHCLRQFSPGFFSFNFQIQCYLLILLIMTMFSEIKGFFSIDKPNDFFNSDTDSKTQWDRHIAHQKPDLSWKKEPQCISRHWICVNSRKWRTLRKGPMTDILWSSSLWSMLRHHAAIPGHHDPISLVLNTAVPSHTHDTQFKL